MSAVRASRGEFQLDLVDAFLIQRIDHQRAGLEQCDSPGAMEKASVMPIIAVADCVALGTKPNRSRTSGTGSHRPAIPS